MKQFEGKTTRGILVDCNEETHSIFEPKISKFFNELKVLIL